MNGATLLAKTAALDPEAVAVRHGQDVLTYAELAEHAARLMRGLLDLGLEAGDRVALMQRNGLALVESLCGLPLRRSRRRPDHWVQQHATGERNLVRPGP
jgi:acyl-CoA synthetase (AMP-forming)/AMP-acid ligase II